MPNGRPSPRADSKTSRRENSSQRWATGYNFPAFKSGDVIKYEFPTTLRRADAGLCAESCAARNSRIAASGRLSPIAFDFESMNRTLFYGSYTRDRQLFRGQRSGLQRPAAGQGTGNPRTSTRTSCRLNCFTQEFKLPVFDKPQSRPRAICAARPQEACLPRRAGSDPAVARWSTRRPASSSGSNFSAMIPTDERITDPSWTMLRRLGIDATLRIVDTSQYVNRFRNFDFDMVTAVLAQSHSPGNEQRDFWVRHAADTPGSRNLCRHQGSGRRRAGRPRHLCDRPRRPGRRHPCARPRAAVELLRRAAMASAESSGSPTGTSSAYRKSSRPISAPTPNSWWIDPAKESALAAKYKGGN